MAEDLLASLGMYGGAFVGALIAGLLPLFPIEVVLLGLALLHPTIADAAVVALLAAIGHQIAKTITYYAGVGALERGKVKEKIDRIRHKIEGWSKAPKLIVFASGLLGFPPLYLIGFIAHPMLGVRILPFTLIVFSTRIVRFFVIAAAPLVL